MDILYLVDRLEELLNEGWRVPLTSKVVIDESECLDLIDQMRISIPEEVKQAKRIQQEKDRLIAQAQEEAERIIALAREENRSLLNGHEVLKQAESQRQAIVEEGRREVRSMKAEADAYVVEVLTNLERQLSGLLTTVRNGLSAVQKDSKQRQVVQEEAKGSD